MDRASRLTQFLRQYDKALYVLKAGTMLQIWRREWPLVRGMTPVSARPLEQFILAITDDWTLGGKPVEWGIEPILDQLKFMDSWRDDSYYDRMMRYRENEEKLKQRSKQNNLRALAMDSRRDIAKASDTLRFGGK